MMGLEAFMIEAQRACRHDLKVPSATDGAGTLCVACACSAARAWASQAKESAFVTGPLRDRGSRTQVPSNRFPGPSSTTITPSLRSRDHPDDAKS